MNEVIVVKNLKKKYKEDRTDTYVLNDINLAVQAGEFLAIVGPSGSGKSTLLNTLVGLTNYDSGCIIINQNDISDLTDDELAQMRNNDIGFVFQEPHMLDDLNIYENIVFPNKYSQKKEKLSNEEIIDLVESVGLSHILHHMKFEVSGGQLQRAAMCRALVNNPKIIFGDEPTGALNKSLTEDILELFHKMNNMQKTIVIITHDHLVASHADRIIYFEDGKILDEKTIGKYSNSQEKRYEEVSSWISSCEKKGVSLC